MTSHDRFIVLERRTATSDTSNPAGGKTFDLLGNKKGSRKLAGFYPDDLALSLDGKLLYVISSGQAEGDPKKPMPAIETFGLELTSGEGRTVSRVEFDPGDDPARFALSASGRCAAVLLAKTNQTVAFDLRDPEIPRLVGRLKPSGAEVPYVSQSADSDWVMMPVASPSEAIAIESPSESARQQAGATRAPIPRPDYVICTPPPRFGGRAHAELAAFPARPFAPHGPAQYRANSTDRACLFTRARALGRVDSLGLDSSDRADLAK